MFIDLLRGTGAADRGPFDGEEWTSAVESFRRRGSIAR
jgi:hypothetical protein